MAKKNRLVDLNDHLFEQLEKLNDDELDGEKLDQEIKRANAMTNIAQNIIAVSDIALRAQKMAHDAHNKAIGTGEVSPMFSLGDS